MADHLMLRDFSADEIVLSDQEIKAVLVFFFPVHESEISSASLTHQLRSFAQGLLVQAIESSYAMGYVERLFRALSRPGTDVRKAVMKFARSAAKHWFKNARANDLLDRRSQI